MHKLLVANRGEIAIRIVRAARELGIATVAIHAGDDAASLHVRHADEAFALPGDGPAAYLDQQAIVGIATRAGCSLVHPGYGFLSENADFARLCADHGLRFIGPSPELLALFGDKITARRFAATHGVPVPQGIDRTITLEEARAFAAEHGAVMLKAIAGGGGRGMRAVHDIARLDEAFARCASEALQSFGHDALYIEQWLPAARHIEVQVVGDGSGAACHLWERDCSIQRRHQKLIEIAPAPALAPATRTRLLELAVMLAREARYASLGTFEFLVSGEDIRFIEANPRLQVEHTVTEEVTGIDLVQTQIRIALGASLAELGIAQPPATRGFAIQARINLETLDEHGTPLPQAGRLTAYTPPSGPNVRVDGYGYTGYATSPRYDPLLAKVIARGTSFGNAAGNLVAALREFHIEGVATGLPLDLAVLRHPDFVAARFDTAFIADHLADLLQASRMQAMIVPVATDAGAVPAAAPEDLPDDGATIAVRAQMTGIVLSVAVTPGGTVRAGDPLAVIEAMKMEQVIRAPVDGEIVVVVASAGATVTPSSGLMRIRPLSNVGETGLAAQSAPATDEGWAREVAELEHRRDMARAMGGQAKLARQHADGKRDVRARISALLDPDSFEEIGALAGFASYDDDGNLLGVQPANFVAGTGRIEGRKIVVGADDFTLRAGSGDAAIHEKQIFSERYAGQMRLPVVRLLDGASGGGSVKMALEHGFHYLPVNPGWDAVVDNLSLVPVVAACLGPTVGLGAARLVMSHLAVMVTGIGQVFTAGPPVVQSATHKKLTKEELGGIDIHRENGVIERFFRNEEEAFGAIRRFLSYLPRSVYELAPRAPCADPADRREEALLSAVPRSERQVYAIEPILDAIFDRNSVFRYAEYGGSTYTALARLNGYPIGVVATDVRMGATMNAQGAQAVTRLVDLCETFHLPLVSLTDQAGMAIGSVAEREGTIRHGARAIAAIYQARIPQAEIIVRRVFGVGGAGAVNRHRASRSWAWPSAIWGSLPQQGGIEAAFRAELDKVPDRQAAVAHIERQLTHIASPFRTAEHFGVQDIIDPRATRALLCDWVEDAWRLLPDRTGRPAFGARP